MDPHTLPRGLIGARSLESQGNWADGSSHFLSHRFLTPLSPQPCLSWWLLPASRREEPSSRLQSQVIISTSHGQSSGSSCPSCCTQAQFKSNLLCSWWWFFRAFVLCQFDAQCCFWSFWEERLQEDSSPCSLWRTPRASCLLYYPPRTADVLILGSQLFIFRFSNSACFWNP